MSYKRYSHLTVLNQTELISLGLLIIIGNIVSSFGAFGLFEAQLMLELTYCKNYRVQKVFVWAAN